MSYCRPMVPCWPRQILMALSDSLPLMLKPCRQQSMASSFHVCLCLPLSEVLGMWLKPHSWTTFHFPISNRITTLTCIVLTFNQPPYLSLCCMKFTSKFTIAVCVRISFKRQLRTYYFSNVFLLFLPCDRPLLRFSRCDWLYIRVINVNIRLNWLRKLMTTTDSNIHMYELMNWMIIMFAFSSHRRNSR